MRFDVDRLGRLAGLPDRERRSLNEAGNRSHHEDRNSDENDHRWGPNQLAEYSGHDGEDDPLAAYEGSDLDEDEDFMTGKRDKRDRVSGLDPFRGASKGDKLGRNENDIPADDTSRGDDEDDEGLTDLGELDAIDWSPLGEADELLEIDEGMLRREIQKMKMERLQEHRLRTAIRGEIQDIFSELGLQQDSSWVYGENKPRNSRGNGEVQLGFLGPGFR